ncbi:MAG TPA: thiamine phosphate synthase [Vicinamibacterales bacterium]
MPLTLPKLYAIVDEQAAALAGCTVPALGRTLMDAGVRLLQLRAKLATGARMLEHCEALRDAAHPHGAMIVVNDRFDVALAAGLRAVHVGQDDLPPALVRRFLGEEGIIGLSTHTREQIDAALYEPIDYLAVGPIFDTGTKDTGYEPVGLGLVEYAASRTELPVVAIGGITLDRAVEVLEAGAASVAVISDLLRDGDPAARVRAYLDAFASGRQPADDEEEA